MSIHPTSVKMKPIKTSLGINNEGPIVKNKFLKLLNSFYFNNVRGAVGVTEYRNSLQIKTCEKPFRAVN